jgi:hypothetical protein
MAKVIAYMAADAESGRVLLGAFFLCGAMANPALTWRNPSARPQKKGGSSHAGILAWTRFRFLNLRCDPISWRWRLGIGVVICAFDDPSDTNHPVNRADLV